MHFYDYWTPSDTIDRPCLLAAQSLIENGLEVMPIAAGTKSPPKFAKELAVYRQNPINNYNVKFNFDHDNVEIAIMLRRNMEVIDVDTKNKAGLSEKFLYSVKNGWPELYEKLVISKTPNGGLHILYYSHKVGGDSILARVPTSKNPLAIVERLNETNKNYIKCAPSKGYEFVQGSPMDMPTLTIEERDWLSAVGASFNEVFIPEVKQKEASREDSPWNVFNHSKDWEYIWDELQQRNWQCVKDLYDRIVVKMAGGKQHSGVIWKETNLLHIYTTNSEFENGKSYSPFGVYCFYYHDGNMALACKQLSSEGIGVNKFEDGQFWCKQGKKIVVKYTELSHWLFHVGYRRYENEIVKITSNVVEIVEERDLKAVFLNEVEPEMVDYFYDKVAGIFSDNGGIMAMLKRLENKFVEDTKDTTWLFFKNYAVKITASGILPMQYKEIDGYIWRESIIPRHFYNDNFTGCDAERFIKILGADEYPKLEKIVGYIISRYKDPLNPRAVIFTEDIPAEEEGESQGGSGKGLLFSFCRQFRKVADFDGKNFRLNDTFVFQNVDLDTNIIFVDDVERHFKFNGLFSILTNSLLINKKNKPQIILPFERSPKIVITSNYSVGAMDISSERRKYEFPIIKHFGKDYEPIDEFKRQFFVEWDEKEWAKFDNYMAYCCNAYLAESNKKAISNITTNSIERSLLSNTNKDFIEYMDGQLACNFFDFAPALLKNYSGDVNGQYTTNGVNYEQWQSKKEDSDYFLFMSKEDFLNKISAISHQKGLTQTRLSQWLKRWATSRKVEIDTRYRRGSANQMCYKIVNFETAQTDLKVYKSAQNDENCTLSNDPNYENKPFDLF
jgi:hypothetical protein